ncbi:hypothetical protein [Gelidibacter maritimus]|uniref:Uncharacterized protein n=1 Tax=Gelidibacter maritimus TaxID=2761487 RepID=A0A7W2M2G7_9FLAO|nr:hypothetical protein [Gelidibacter maritimus]MBA6151522.1 hypothetical protein [Gelidibacter maritimus]
MNSEDILNRVEDFTAEQLFEFINQEIVSLDELRTTGNLDASKRKAITTLQNEYKHVDDGAWKNYRHTEEGCRTYLTEFPTGIHASEAKQKLENYAEESRKRETEKIEILEKLRTNKNSFSADDIQGYLGNGTLSRNDLLHVGIPEGVIDRLNNIVLPQLRMGKTPDSIPDGYTEVYFWGIPGSGKTCALSAVLSTANTKGYLEFAQGPGFKYMTGLKNIFANSTAILPPPSPVDSTQYLPFVLRKGNEDPRSVSLIELSGEIFQCFFHKNAGDNLPTPEHEATLDSLLRFLDGDNRKIHFFFVDYEKKNNLDVDGYTQADYLQAAAIYFKDNNIFSKSTDAIYIVVTKSDLMPSIDKNKVNDINVYLQNANFTSFINSLKVRCKENSINSGKILGTHFSLGEVYFDQICSFDSETSENIIDILIRRIAPNKKSILDVFNK